MLSLEEMLSAGCSSAIRAFRANGRLTAMVHVHDAVSGSVVPFLFKTDDEQARKHAIVSVVGKLRRLGRFGGAVIQSEAWKALEHQIPKGGRPENSPQRVEQIVIVAFDAMGNRRMMTCDILRAGDVVELTPWKTWPDKFESWFDLAFSDAEKILASK